MIIGIVGKAGCGKSTIARRLLSRISSELIVGDEVVDQHYKNPAKFVFFWKLITHLCGTLDRNRVREVLFADPHRMALVEAYFDDVLTKHIEDFFTCRGCDHLIVDGANLLHFPESLKYIDHIFEISSNDEVRLARLSHRDSVEKGRQLIEFQKNMSFETNIPKTVVINNGLIESALEQIELDIKRLCCYNN